MRRRSPYHVRRLIGDQMKKLLALREAGLTYDELAQRFGLSGRAAACRWVLRARENRADEGPAK